MANSRTQDFSTILTSTGQVAANLVANTALATTGVANTTQYLRGDMRWTTISVGSGAAGANGQVFTSNGTFTIPSGITQVKVTVVGGGGTGAAGQSGCTNTGGAGGGAGGTAIKFLSGLTSGATLSVTVGAAYRTSTVSSGTQSITTISATPGSNASSGSTGGSGSNGDINISGQRGGYAHLAAGGAGGSSVLGFGGVGGWQVGSAGSDAVGYGSGSGGGSGTGVTAYNPGTPASGIVLFEW